MLKLGRIKKLFGAVKERAGKKEDDRASRLEKAAAAAESRAAMNLNEELRQRYAALLETTAIKEDHILYEAFGGRGMTCSPYAFFCCLLEQEEYKDFVHVWVIDDFEDNAWQRKAYASYPNVRFVKYQSMEYREALATCKYLINNVSFPGFFTKREGQVYINTWHGIPLKTIGFDIPTGNVSNGNSARNLLAADYLMSPNSFMTKIYEDAFKLKGLYQGAILEEGQPRNDRYFHGERAKVFEKLKACGVSVSPEKKLILYAPTWKGSKYSSPDTSLDTYYEIIRVIERNVDTSQYQVLVKPHQIVYYHIKKNQGVTDRFIPATMDTNELLSVVDVLISDYSSIYFDFLVSGRPILFFIPDLDEYLGYRGLYFGIDKLPGPIAVSYEELGRMVRDPEAAMEPCREAYEREAAWACPHDDGEVCKRVTDIVFGKKEPEKKEEPEDQEASEKKEEPKRKKRLLLYGGAMGPTRSAASLAALSHLVDYDRYDVTAVVEAAQDEEEELRIRSLPAPLRVLYRGQPENGTPRELGAIRLYLDGKEEEDIVPPGFFRRELRRMFGDASFDAAVDLTGERTLFSCLGRAMVGCKCVSFPETFLDLKEAARAKKKEDVLSLGGELCFLDQGKGMGTSLMDVTAVPLPEQTGSLYAAMGELGEQALGALLEQFAFVYEKEKGSRLCILGKCPGMGALKKQAEENGLLEAVLFTGPLKRPWGFLAHCDAFVLPKGGREDDLMPLYARALGVRLCREDFTPLEREPFDGEEYDRRLYEKLERFVNE